MFLAQSQRYLRAGAVGKAVWGWLFSSQKDQWALGFGHRGLEGQKCHSGINYKDFPFFFFFIFRATTEEFVLHWGFPQSCPKLVPAERWQLGR